MRYLLLLLLAWPAWALQTQNMELISPITGQRFETVGVPSDQPTMAAELADLGADDDGCRHTSGPNEYDYYVAVCPYSYFAALSAEWDSRSGQFREELPPEMKDWVQKAFNTDWQLDRGRAFTSAQQTARISGRPLPDRKEFVMPQESIALEKRYRLALQCYEHRGARSVVLGKIALTGAWALRARLNVPIGHRLLDGGYEEVRDLADRLVKPGEPFSLAKLLPAYRSIFEGGSSLTNEGYFVAGMTYFGFVLRDGDLRLALKILDDMTERFGKEEKPSGELMRGLVRERRRTLEEYAGPFKPKNSGQSQGPVGLLTIAANNFMAAIAAQEFPRIRLPANMLAVAECLRRSSQTDADLRRAYDWYLALSKMPETQPGLRDDIRSQGKAPGPDAPFHVSLGWVADTQLAKLKAAGIDQGSELSGPDRRLLTAIVFERFGSSDYVDANWRPRVDGTQADCEMMLKLIGQATMDFTFRGGSWPKSLDDLWEQDVIKDRNRVNRFYCPVTGKRFQYVPMSGDVTTASPRTVVIATAAPISTPQGMRYGAYLAGDKVIWSESPMQAGAQAR